LAVQRAYVLTTTADNSFRLALLDVLAEPSADGSGTRLRALALRLVAQAEAGDREAMREVLDRLDGRPFTADEPERPPVKLVFGWRNAFEPPEAAEQVEDAPSVVPGAPGI
jgi:hypothetical protein